MRVEVDQTLSEPPDEWAHIEEGQKVGFFHFGIESNEAGCKFDFLARPASEAIGESLDSVDQRVDRRDNEFDKNLTATWPGVKNFLYPEILLNVIEPPSVAGDGQMKSHSRMRSKMSEYPC